MNLIAYSLLPALMLLLYGGLIATWIHLANRPDGRVEEIAERSGLAALGLYLIWMAVITAIQRQIPVLTFGQLAAFLGFIVWAGQSLVQTKVRQRLLVILPAAAVALLILAAITSGLHPAKAPDSLRGLGAALHIALSLAGIAMLLGSGVFGAGLLILHRQIAHRVFGRFFSSLPSMDEMDRLRIISVNLGWLLISISLISAMFWMRLVRTDSKVMESHLHPMLTLWVLVTILALTARFKWLRRTRLAAISVGLAALVLGLAMVSVVEFFVGAWL